MKSLIARFVREEEGQDVIEYALLAALIGVLCMAGMTLVENAVNLKFGAIATALA
jgi:pilus assembly protein Flp/PilA